MKNKCDECKFYREYKIKFINETIIGECYLNPPTVTNHQNGGTHSSYPLVRYKAIETRYKESPREVDYTNQCCSFFKKN